MEDKKNLIKDKINKTLKDIKDLQNFIYKTNLRTERIKEIKKQLKDNFNYLTDLYKTL